MKCARKIFIVFVTLSDLNKTSNRAVTHTSYKMHETFKCSTVRVVCTCDQCDSAFCELQLTALIKPKWWVLLYGCACIHPNTILMEAGWTAVPCPATNLSILIRKSSARTKQCVISVALKTSVEIRLGICLYETSLLHPMTIHWFHTKLTPTLYNKIAPMQTGNDNQRIFCVKISIFSWVFELCFVVIFQFYEKCILTICYFVQCVGAVKCALKDLVRDVVAIFTYLDNVEKVSYAPMLERDSTTLLTVLTILTVFV